MQGWPKRYAEVLGQRMAYVEAGSGLPVVFLHGNPTSSWLWRNILPACADQYRCIAPDLIGMGDSAKLPDSGPGCYSFATHSDYLEALLEELNVGSDVVLVVHDWGSALGFDWARRHPDRVRGIAYMEAIVRPIVWDEWPEPSQPIFRALRSEVGEELILQKNIFIEKILPSSIKRDLSDAEMHEYRRPYLTPGEDRRPTLDWPRQIPISGEPANICDLVETYADWLATSDVPKLFVDAEPGAILVGAQRDFCRGWPNQTEVTVSGIHFIQEDSAAEIAEALQAWLADLPAVAAS